MCNCNQQYKLNAEIERMLYGEEEFDYSRMLQREGGSPGTGGGSVPLAGTALAGAVRDNRLFANLLHWGCIVAGKVRANNKVLDLLKFPAGVTPTEEAWAKAVAAWQKTKLKPQDGKLNSAMWKLISGSIPLPRFQPLVSPVFSGGKKIGFIEKTMPYRKCYFDAGDTTCYPVRRATSKQGGADIQLGFRITDMDAVKKAGFVNAKGEAQFNWIQTLEFITVPDKAKGGYLRRYSQVIDPTDLVDPKGTLDNHPYYFDLVTRQDPKHPNDPLYNADPKFHISNFINRSADNLLCYDLIFKDKPKFRLTAARPGYRAYFNFELALVGIKDGTPTKNVILNTIRWGYDLAVEGGNTNVHLNNLSAGQPGGSTSFRKIMSKQIADFPGHCFVGEGFTGTARCK